MIDFPEEVYHFFHRFTCKLLFYCAEISGQTDLFHMRISDLCQ